MTYSELARMLNRPWWSVFSKIKELGLKRTVRLKRRPGRRIKQVIAVMPKECYACGTTATYRWYRNFPVGYICKNCYHDIIYYKRKYPPGEYHKRGEMNPNYGKVGAMRGRYGEQHPMWKNVKTSPIHASIRTLNEYRIWRKAVFERDDYTCQKCGKRGGKLHAHHMNKSFALIIYKNKIKTIEDARNCMELWDPNNGETLCLNCHRSTADFLRNFKKENTSSRIY